LPISYSTTAPVTPLVGVTAGSGAITTANATDTFDYGNSYNAPLANVLYHSSSPTPNGTDYNFYDDYVFTVSGSTLSSVSSTISLGNFLSIQNLQARLYAYTPAANWQPALAACPLGCTEGWGASFTVGGNTGSLSILNDIQVSAGTYVLELRGNVTGTSGGSYSGVLNVAPVPAPAAFWLMGSAIAGLGTIGRKRAHR